MFSHRGEKALEKIREHLCSDDLLIHHETKAVEQEEGEREEGEQGEKCKRGSQTGASMAQKRPDEVSEETKGLHRARWAVALLPTYHGITSRLLLHLVRVLSDERIT